MKKKLYKIFSGIGAFVLLIGIASVAYGVSLPSTPAKFETSLAGSILATDTSMTLVRGTDFAGNSLSGYTCFTIDEGSPKLEYVCGTASGTSITALVRGIDPMNPNSTSSALAYQHRIGATVKITDFPVLQLMYRLLSGLDNFVSVLRYSSSTYTQFSDPRDIVNKAYVDADNASTTLWTISGNDIYNANSANVGIGTSTPATKLYVLGSSTVSGNQTVLGTETVAALAVSGNSLFTGPLQTNSSAAFTSTTSVSSAGVLNVSSTANFSGNVNLNGTTAIAGTSLSVPTTTVSGNIQIGSNNITNSTGDSVIGGGKVIAASSTNLGLADTTTETYLTTTTIPANTIYKNGGLLIRISVSWGTSGAGSGAAVLYANFGGTKVCAWSGGYNGAQTGTYWGECIIRGNNSTSSQISFTDGTTTGSALANVGTISNEATSAIDTTQDQYLSLSGVRGGGSSMGGMTVNHWAIFKLAN